LKRLFIGEIKVKSPFGFKSPHNFADLLLRANKVADMISVHTDPRWGGSFSDIEYVREHTKKPILAKGVHSTDQEIEKALLFGADYVLVVGRIPSKSLLDKCLIEPKSIEQLREFVGHTHMMVWNSRDLDTGGLKTETWEQAKEHCPRLIQASNIKSRADVKADALGFIVGEHLMSFQ
jgi:indole-3-glycerol phosphate synthase